MFSVVSKKDMSMKLTFKYKKTISLFLSGSEKEPNHIAK